MKGEEKPIFSIIIPAYNRAWCIERAVESILSQNIQDWELIIVDDGSTDNTKNIIKQYLTDQRVRYFYKENGGVGSARNIGMKNLNSDVFMFLDSDDELVSGALKLIYLAVQKYKDKKIFSFRAIDQNGQQVSYSEKVLGDRIINFADFVSQEYIKGEAFLVFKRDIFRGKYFDEDVNGGEGLLLLGLIKENDIMLVDEDARIYHIESPDSLVNSKITNKKVNNICKIQMRLIEKYGGDLKRNNRKYLGTAYFVLARALALSGKKNKSLKYFFLGCRYNSLDIKRILIYGVSLFDYNLKINNAISSLCHKHEYE